MHGTSDFPTLLSASGNRVLHDAYALAASPLKTLAQPRNRTDFRPVTGVQLSEPPRLLKTNEHGEVDYGTRAEESRPRYTMATFARIFSLTCQAIINDDLGAFSEALIAFGRGAAQTENDELVALFTANSGNGVTLWDTKALYHTDHGNKAATGAAPSVATLGAARQTLREMKDIDDQTAIGVTPKHLVVGPALETVGEQVLAEIAAAQVSDVNPFTGKLTLHVEPRFTGNAWRMFADPAQLPVIEVAHLSGQEGPQLESRDGWTTLGTEFRAVLDFGCGIIEWRGTYLNAGAC